MKMISVCCIAIVLIAAMLTGCGASNDTKAPEAVMPDMETAASTQTSDEVSDETSAEADEETVTEDIEDESDNESNTYSYYIDEAYAEQIGRYYTALSEKWDEGRYFENGMSSLPVYYYEGNPLENVGFGFVDLDNDGTPELIIGAIMNAETDPAVFEIWTLVNGEPLMLAQGASRNRYVLEYVEEDQMWYVVNEGSNGAADSATYYLMLSEGKFEVIQGVVLDAIADEANPWFLTYDPDWDVSNDEPIDEATAISILESNRKLYAAPEYFPYTYY